MKAFYLQFKGSRETHLRSDTLWGMVISALSWIHQKKEINNIVQSFISGDNPFRISSAFPFMSHIDGLVHFLPTPVLPPEKPSEGKVTAEFIKRHKKFKKKAWLSEEALKPLLENSSTIKDWVDASLDDSTAYNHKVELSLHNSINRLTNSTTNPEGEGQLYYTQDIYSEPGSGLYFLADGNRVDLIIEALNWYKLQGLGANASTGKGNFDWEVKEAPTMFSHNQKGNCQMLLSAFNPSGGEIDALFSENDGMLPCYDLEIRAGKMKMNSSVIDGKPLNYRKKGIAVIKESALLPSSGEKPWSGSLVKTASKPNHDVYHYGRAFTLKMNIKL